MDDLDSCHDGSGARPLGAHHLLGGRQIGQHVAPHALVTAKTVPEHLNRVGGATLTSASDSLGIDMGDCVVAPLA